MAGCWRIRESETGQLEAAGDLDHYGGYGHLQPTQVGGCSTGSEETGDKDRTGISKDSKAVDGDGGQCHPPQRKAANGAGFCDGDRRDSMESAGSGRLHDQTGTKDALEEAKRLDTVMDELMYNLDERVREGMTDEERAKSGKNEGEQRHTRGGWEWGHERDDGIAMAD